MAFRDLRHRGRAPAPPALASALKRFYALRFAVTAMTMLSAVLLPWIVWSATHRLDLAALVMLVEAAVRLTMSLYGGQLAHATGGRVSSAGAQALCAVGFAIRGGRRDPTRASPSRSRAAACGDRRGCSRASRSATSSPRRARSRCCNRARPTSPRACASSISSIACALPPWRLACARIRRAARAVALGFSLRRARGGSSPRARAASTTTPMRACPRAFRLVDREAWQWLGRTRRARSLTLFLLVASVPVTMLSRRAAVPAREPHGRRPAGLTGRPTSCSSRAPQGASNRSARR